MPAPSSPSHGAAPDQDPLAKEEAELTREVPLLLDSMNRGAAEVNTYERQLSEAQERYRKLLEQWSRLYEDWRSQYGSAIDRARPYFEAAQALEVATQRVNASVREFSASNQQSAQAKIELRGIEERLAYGAHKVTLDRDQQDGLSRATVRVLKSQQERDRHEQEYTRLLKEYREAQESAEAWRAQIGDAAIRRALPCFRQLQEHQRTLALEQSRINALVERTASAKSMYSSSMRELDRISVAVHDARRRYREATPKPHVEVKEAAPELDVPEVESPMAGDAKAALDEAAAMVFGEAEERVVAPAVRPFVLAKGRLDDENDSPFA